MSTSAVKRLDIERTLVCLPEDATVRLNLTDKEGYAVAFHEMKVKVLMVKSGGKRKRGDQLAASVRKEVVQVLKDGGSVGYTTIPQ